MLLKRSDQLDISKNHKGKERNPEHVFNKNKLEIPYKFIYFLFLEFIIIFFVMNSWDFFKRKDIGKQPFYFWQWGMV